MNPYRITLSICLSRHFFSETRGVIELKLISNTQSTFGRSCKKIKVLRQHNQKVQRQIFDTRKGIKTYDGIYIWYDATSYSVVVLRENCKKHIF